MEFSTTTDYPAAPHEVAAMLVDAVFVQRKLEASGATRTAKDIRRDGDAATISTRMAMPTDQLPQAFRSFVGSSLDVRLVEAWEPAADDGERRGTLSLDIVGAPVRVAARLRLEPLSDGGTRQHYHGTVSASIPILGKHIEQAATEAVEKVVAVERRIGLEYLDEQR